jgi:DNA invertase Pin-like site-specific DNA recombinase
MTAYGYIRKSVVHDPARMLSPETQEAAIRGLAERHGDDDVVILSDLDVSGKKDRTRRPGWDELLRAVEDGDASAVYAYSLSRFARSVSQLAAFFDLCEQKRVAVRIERDHIDTSTATGKLVGNVLASLAQFESDVASERVRDAFATKRVNDPSWRRPGNPTYGDLDGEDPGVVVAAFREAGSFDGAARLLNERGVPSRLRGAVWHGSVVSAIVRRHAPNEVSPSTSRGAKAGTRSFRLARLLACGTCGARLTGSMDGRTSTVRYYCHRAKVTPHPRKWVTESTIIGGIVAEVEHITPDAWMNKRRTKKGSAADEAALGELDAKRRRYLEMYGEGLVDKPTRDAKLAEIANAEAKLSSVRWVSQWTVPPLIADVVDEDGTVVPAGQPADVNAFLRRLFDRVTVDMSEPARRGKSSWVPSLAFAWRNPDWRSA